MARTKNDILKNPEQILAAARYTACFQLQPYMACAIQNLIPQWVEGLGTIGVTEHMHLLIDADKFTEWYREYGIEICGWIIIHEVNHILRGHTARARRLGLPASEKGVVNACMDAEINDDIPDALKKLPKGWCWLPKDLNKQEPGKLWEEYYNNLPTNPDGKKYIKVRGSKKGGQSQGGGKKDPNDKTQDAPQDGGHCGSGATGHPFPQEEGLKGREDKDTPDPKSADKPGQPDQTDQAAGRSPAEIERIKNQVAADIQAAMKGPGRGSIPAGLQRWAQDQLRPPTIPWRQLLAKVTRGAVGMAAGQKNYTYRKPSRRQAGVGTGLGCPVLPRMYSPLPRILIGFDTSGSMSEEALTACLAEVGGILKSSNTDVTVCACDAKVHAATKVRKIGDAARALKGGGGTDFRPVFKYADDMRHKPDVLFLFTDGDGPAPSKAPRRYDVVWILVDGYARARVPYDENGKTVDYGKIVRVPPITNGIETPHADDDDDD